MTSSRQGPSSRRNSFKARLEPALHDLTEPVITARSWTTDAPYRETSAAIESAIKAGATCVEMEAAALYALAEARDYAIVCIAHITNTMAVTENDFEKGEANRTQRGYFFHPHVGVQLDRGLDAPLVIDGTREPGGYDAEWVVDLDD